MSRLSVKIDVANLPAVRDFIVRVEEATAMPDDVWAYQVKDLLVDALDDLRETLMVERPVTDCHCSKTNTGRECSGGRP